MGDNFYLGDRNGSVRRRNGARPNAGFSREPAASLSVIVDPQFHYESVNVETQQNNLHSPVVDGADRARKRHQAFGRGTITFSVRATGGCSPSFAATGTSSCSS